MTPPTPGSSSTPAARRSPRARARSLGGATVLLATLLARCGGDAAPAGDGYVPLLDASFAQPDASCTPADCESSTPAGLATYVLPLLETSRGLADGLFLNISVGGGPAHEVILDTGSGALVTSKSSLGTDVTFPSPAQPFTLEYTSNGLIFTGETAMARVALGVGTGFAGGDAVGLPMTTTMPVRVVEAASCDPTYPACEVPSDLSTVGVLGVGFGRGATPTPTTNALLQVQDVASGAMTPGFVVSVHPPQLTVGLPAGTDGFARVALAPLDGGDWSAASLEGCAVSPDAWSVCGTLLVDTGLDYAILALPSGADAPFDGGAAPDGTAVDFLAPEDGGAMRDAIEVGATSLQTPTSVEVRRSADGVATINTGRRVLALYDYLFDGRAGSVGFRPSP